MKVISQEICTVHTSVTVEESEVSWFFPVSYIVRFGKVEYDSTPIFVVFSDRPLIGGGRICSDSAMSILGVFGGFKVADGHEHLR